MSVIQTNGGSILKITGNSGSVNNKGKIGTVTNDSSIVDYMSQRDVPLKVCWQTSGTLNAKLNGIITLVL